MRSNPLGRSDVRVTELGLGGTGLGNLYAPIPTEVARATVIAAHRSEVGFFDTAPSYGNGLSELRLGAALAEVPREEVVVSTKVGYALEPLAGRRGARTMFADALPYRPRTDFSLAAVERSLADSLERLGLDRVDVVWLHDPDEAASLRPDSTRPRRNHFEQAMSDAYPFLARLREQGTIGAIGVGMNQSQMLVEFARAGDFDCFLLGGRYTLLEQEPLDALLPLCLERGIGIVVGGPFASGILATGAVDGARYNYRSASAAILDKVRRLDAVCRHHEVPLAAAALQLPLAHPAVCAVLAGAGSPAEIEQNAALLRVPIPGELWFALRHEGLLDPRAPVPRVGKS
jgi:D-threo-aldose 1-dehydrogenase